MLQVLSQTNLDTVLFIGNDEPIHRVVAVNLGLFKKEYHCEGTGAMSTTFMTDVHSNRIEGLRTRFTKTRSYSRHSQNRSYFKRKTINENTETELTVSRNVKHFGKIEILIKITPSVEDRKKLLDVDVLSRYSRHIKTTEEKTILPALISSANIGQDIISPKLEEDEENAKLALDTIVVRVKNFENNFKQFYPLLVLRDFTEISNSTAQNISLAEFDKFNKQLDIIEEVSIPTNYARKKFIEICEIFKNNNVLTKLKANNFEFRKDRHNLVIELFGVPVINEKNFKHFQYFDHPGINFCADYLDKSRTFDIIEAKISKEIITRI